MNNEITTTTNVRFTIVRSPCFAVFVQAESLVLRVGLVLRFPAIANLRNVVCIHIGQLQ
jgi:hypothetical protein